MTRQIPMDISIHIIKHTEVDSATLAYSARLAIGRPNLQLDSNSEEVFWCGAAGKSIFACISALKERAYLWANTHDIREIAGLFDNNACPLTIHACEAGEIEIVPVTYNNWLVEPEYVYDYTTHHLEK